MNKKTNKVKRAYAYDNIRKLGQDLISLSEGYQDLVEENTKLRAKIKRYEKRDEEYAKSSINGLNNIVKTVNNLTD